MNSLQLKKQNEINERIIRELMNLEENKKCFDCTSRAITHVNLSLNTFVCTECGNLLKTINHRIKSIYPSSLSLEEIIELQNGGNEKAKHIWLAKWNNSYREPNHNLISIEQRRDFIRKKYVNKLWFRSPDSIEIENPKVDIISVPRKKKHESHQKISKSFNEIEFFNRCKSINSSKTSPTKSSPSKSLLNKRSPSTLSDYDIEIQNNYNLQTLNPYLLLDDENDEPFNTSENVTPSMDIYSNSIIETNVYNNNINKLPSIDIYSNAVVNQTDNNNAKDIYNPFEKYASKRNSHINNENQIINHHVSYNEHISHRRNEKTNLSYNNINRSLSENVSQITNRHSSYNNYSNHKRNDENNANYVNINCNLNENINTKSFHDTSNSTQKQIFDNYPVYPPRSSSLFNKSLLDSVCHTKNKYFIDNKKVYFYKKKTHHSSRK